MYFVTMLGWNYMLAFGYDKSCDVEDPIRVLYFSSGYLQNIQKFADIKIFFDWTPMPIYKF